MPGYSQRALAHLKTLARVVAEGEEYERRLEAAVETCRLRELSSVCELIAHVFPLGLGDDPEVRRARFDLLADALAVVEQEREIRRLPVAA
jgi:hypothetical protein